ADDQNERGGSEECPGIAGLHAVELAGDYANGSERRDSADDGSAGNESQSLPQDHAQHIGARCAQGHADADFLSAARYGIRNHAVNSQQRQHQAHTGKYAEQNGVFARSEEHTSELQSPYDLVCRLLLEKKKTYKDAASYMATTDDKLMLVTFTE